MLQPSILRRGPAGQQVENIGIRQGKEVLEGGSLIHAGRIERASHVTHQHNIKLAHTTATAPFDPRAFRIHQKCPSTA